MRKNQTLRVLQFLRENNGATALEIERSVGFGDARKHISDLRKAGFEIGDIWEDHEGGRHKRYWLEGESNG